VGGVGGEGPRVERLFFQGLGASKTPTYFPIVSADLILDQHDLRGIHSTALLDAGIPVHTVAQRTGDDPATLLRSYTAAEAGRRTAVGHDRRVDGGIPGCAR